MKYRVVEREGHIFPAVWELQRSKFGLVWRYVTLYTNKEAAINQAQTLANAAPVKKTVVWESE